LEDDPKVADLNHFLNIIDENNTSKSDKRFRTLYIYNFLME